MQTSTIKFSQIKDRIDAEYYKPEYLAVASDLDKNKKVKLLDDIVNVIVNGVEFRTYSKKGKPYLRVSDIKEIFMDLSNVKFISEDSKFSKNIELSEGDILTSRSGTLGISAIAPKNGGIISSHLIRISPKKEINSYYLVTFLNSRYGRSQILQENNGAVVPEINQPALKSIKIPILSKSFQQKIEKMVRESQRKRKLADEKYEEAEEILNGELGLNDLDLSTQNTFEIKFSETEDRFDPEYYQPKYKKIKNLIIKNRFKSKPLKSFVKKYNCGLAFSTETYSEKGVPLLRIKNLKKMGINFRGVRFLPDLNEYQEFIAKSGDILISMSGTVGLASLVPENISKAFVNQRITSISTEGINKLYLCFYLNLPAINLLMIRKTTGGVQKNITYQDIISIQIPILPKPTQQKISSLIQKSFQLRKEAKELIEKAKQEVEEMILK